MELQNLLTLMFLEILAGLVYGDADRSGEFINQVDRNLDEWAA